MRDASSLQSTPGSPPLKQEHRRTHWYERVARRELERRIENWERPREHWLSETGPSPPREVDRAGLFRSLRQLSQAIDPLSGIDPRAHDLDRQRDIGIER